MSKIHHHVEGYNMINERVTEDIVREHFKVFGDHVILEEQNSSEPKIRKLLERASKSGPGRGHPEFIVRLKEEPRLLIIVECKANPNRHQSATLNMPDKYAVDGALHYASYLIREYDVLAIAVSGVEAATVRVSHFFRFQDSYEHTPVFGDRLLQLKDYIEQYQIDPAKVRQDFQSLHQFIRDLNDDLHRNKVSEKNRSLLISAIMIALERRPFKESYLFESDPTRLAKTIVSAVVDELQDAKIARDRLDVLTQKFSFLPLETKLLESDMKLKKNELRRIVEMVDAQIKGSMISRRYVDVLGTLYVEFLRHANSDKGLGIVLTPPHIAELFSDLAQVNSKSIVYDNCAGTGGFLIGAMKRMMEDAKGSKEAEGLIKRQQLYGVEIQSDIFPLAVSNMFIHQDGKSNILLGNCFDPEIMASIRDRRPTVGMLNPPYKSNKKQDTEELEFVINNLECLSQGSICVCIVPMQCALATGGKIGELKRRLLKEHTLRAVLSMPNDLFFNSNVGVVSCIMVFEAGRRHPDNQEVFLGYFKDDGFVKRKIGGRYDALGNWGRTRQIWLDLYRNKRSVPGLSVNRALGSADEWAAEAYMETDYTLLTDATFDDTLHAYSAYLFGAKVVKNVSDAPIKKEGKEGSVIDTSAWDTVKLSDIFRIVGTKTTSLRDLQAMDCHGLPKYPFVTTQATNNGVRHFFDRHTEVGGVLTVDSAVIGYCSYQAHPFTASDHVEKLIPRFTMNAYHAMFLVTVINLEQYRYNYGRKSSQARMRVSNIRLPTRSSGDIDLDYMENYIQSRPYSSNLSKL